MDTETYFYCLNLVGDPDFSIEEWNEVFKSVQGLPEADKRAILDDPPPCEKQCFKCMAIVGKQRLKTKNLTGNPEDSPARAAYIEWFKNGKPPHKLYPININE